MASSVTYGIRDSSRLSSSIPNIKNELSADRTDTILIPTSSVLVVILPVCNFTVVVVDITPNSPGNYWKRENRIVWRGGKRERTRKEKRQHIMKMRSLICLERIAAVFVAVWVSTDAFSLVRTNHRPHRHQHQQSWRHPHPRRHQQPLSFAAAEPMPTMKHGTAFVLRTTTLTVTSVPQEDPATLAAVTTATAADIPMSKAQRKALIRQEGGPLAFDTKYGALNPFAIYYGLTSIALGLVWYVALVLYQGLRFITRGRLDPYRRIPIFLNQIWGESLLILTRCRPVMERRDILKKFYRE